MRSKLTDRGIAAFPAAAPDKRDLHYDAVVPGLAVRVTDRGAKSFVLVGRFPGSTNPTARAIGRVGAVTLLDARTRAREWLAQLAAGIDPATIRADRNAETFRSVAEDFQRRDGAKLRSAGWRMSLLARAVFPVIGDRPVADLRRSEIVALLDAVEDERGLVMRNRTLALVRRILNWYASRSDDYVSPIAGVEGAVGCIFEVGSVRRDGALPSPDRRTQGRGDLASLVRGGGGRVDPPLFQEQGRRGVGATALACRARRACVPSSDWGVRI